MIPTAIAYPTSNQICFDPVTKQIPFFRQPQRMHIIKWAHIYVWPKSEIGRHFFCPTRIAKSIEQRNQSAQLFFSIRYLQST